MLEEGLRSPTFSPADAAQGLLSFVRFELQDGGAAAEKRFIGLLTLLCERLYGPMSSDPKESFRHETGGWLSRINRWEIPRPPRSGAHHTHTLHHQNTTPSLEMDPVVQLLCGIEALSTSKSASRETLPTFIEAISGTTEARQGVRVQFPFYALPKPTQDFVLKMVQCALERSAVDDSSRHNAFRLFGGLMRVPPRDQVELRRLQAAKTQKVEQHRSRPLTLSPGGMPSPSMRFSSSLDPTDRSNMATQTKPHTPHIMLNMVEYFLLTFIRYPLASPAPPTPAPQGHAGITRHHLPRVSGRQTPYGESVYMHLFRCYLLHYLPKVPQGNSFCGFPNLSTEQELFLRIIVELWLCGTMDVTPVQKAAEALWERRRKHGGSSTSTPDGMGLESAFDLVKVAYSPTIPQVQKCLKSLIAHILKDPLLSPAICDSSDVASKQQQQQQQHDDGTALPLPWCLSPSMTILQPSFYVHVMVSFRHAPIHLTGSPFYAALDTWLLWLEPWNVEMRRKNHASDFSQAGASVLNSVKHMSPSKSSRKPEIVHVLKVMKSTARSKYAQKWEPFIAANLYLYIVPLALFLRRARELDFSSQYFLRSFTLLQRVFRVYSPEVMASINRLLSEGAHHSMSSLVEAHNKNLGAYSPTSVGQIHMSSLQDDMHNLLEEVYMQYRKTVRDRGFLDRVEAKVESFFSYLGVVESSTGEERKIQQLVEQARLVAGLPADYTILPRGDENGGAATTRNAGHSLGSSEDVATGGIIINPANGLLTDAGKSQVIAGEIKCRPADLIHRHHCAADGDDAPSSSLLHGSVKSHELSLLVHFTIHLSEYLNSRLAVKSFNLRFLADYRNLLVLVFVTWIWTRFFLW